MKRYILVVSLMLCITTGLAISQETQSEEPAGQSEAVPDQTESKKDCKKVCVQRDGYGMCTEFEERCKED